jgi:hypothetical protein
MRKPNHFKPFAPHHLYIGLFTLILSILMIPYTYYTGIRELLFLAGFLVILDDFIEHTVTADTPLRIFFEKIIDPIIRFLNQYRIY